MLISRDTIRKSINVLHSDRSQDNTKFYGRNFSTYSSVCVPTDVISMAVVCVDFVNVAVF